MFLLTSILFRSSHFLSRDIPITNDAHLKNIFILFYLI